MSESQTSPSQNPALGVAERFAGRLLRAALDAVQNQRTMWAVTPQQDQQKVIDRLRETFHGIIIEQMADVAAAGFVRSEVVLSTLTAKGETIKAIVNVGDNKTLHELVDRIGRKVVLVLVDGEQYAVGMESFEAMKDQPDLEFGGSDPDAEA